MGVFDALGLVGPWILGVAALLTAINAMRRGPSENRRDNSDSAAKVASAAAALIAPYESRLKALELVTADQAQKIVSLEAMLKAAQDLNAEYLKGIERLVHQVRSLGYTPVYVPDMGASDNG